MRQKFFLKHYPFQENHDRKIHLTIIVCSSVVITLSRGLANKWQSFTTCANFPRSSGSFLSNCGWQGTSKIHYLKMLGNIFMNIHYQIKSQFKEQGLNCQAGHYVVIHCNHTMPVLLYTYTLVQWSHT